MKHHDLALHEIQYFWNIVYFPWSEKASLDLTRISIAHPEKILQICI